MQESVLRTALIGVLLTYFPSLSKPSEGLSRPHILECFRAVYQFSVLSADCDKGFREGVQLTSRSGVLKLARSRVKPGESAKGGGGACTAASSLLLWHGRGSR